MDLFYWLTSSLYRREDYINVLISDLGLMTTYSLGIHKSDGLHLFLHWVDFSSKWKAIKKYFLQELLKLATQEKSLKVSATSVLL